MAEWINISSKATVEYCFQWKYEFEGINGLNSCWILQTVWFTNLHYEFSEFVAKLQKWPGTIFQHNLFEM